jgi:hypothetical protein
VSFARSCAAKMALSSPTPPYLSDLSSFEREAKNQTEQRARFTSYASTSIAPDTACKERCTSMKFSHSRSPALNGEKRVVALARHAIPRLQIARAYPSPSPSSSWSSSHLLFVLLLPPPRRLLLRLAAPPADAATAVPEKCACARSASILQNQPGTDASAYPGGPEITS